MTTSYNPDYDQPPPPFTPLSQDSDPYDIDANPYDNDDELDDELDGELDEVLDDEEKQQRLDNGEIDAAFTDLDPLQAHNHIDINMNPFTIESQSVSAPNHRLHHINNHNHRHSLTSSSSSTLNISSTSTSSTMSVTSPNRDRTANHRTHSTKKRKSKYNISTVERIISITPTCYLKPKCFFVAWNSVITLVFNGWPEPIATMKKELASSCTVCKEMFGSKFPKITLGCVKDGIEMTPKLLAKVRRLCEKCPVPKDYVLCIDSLNVVLWENRCQESIIYEKIIPTKKNHKFLGSPGPLLLNMEDQNDSPYLRSANRTSHYRSLVIGSSIVHRLVHVPKFITDFQAKLPREIYDVFGKESLHVTIRSLC